MPKVVFRLAGLTLLACLAAAATALPGAGLAGCAFAQATDAEEKADFDAAKELGSVDAWKAFLAHYPDGFHADLARAYLKKLGEEGGPGAAAAPATSGADDPVVAGTWGGIVRSGPSKDTAKVASLKEGEEVTLLGPPVPDASNDYPWFKISFRDGQSGFMWGGLLCSTGPERPDLFKLCTFTPVRIEANSGGAAGRPAKPRLAAAADQPSWCRTPGNATERAICDDPDLRSLDSVLNVAYRRAKFDSPGQKEDIEHWQKRWIGQRNLCGEDVDCIGKRYNEQIQVLESYFGN